MNPLFVRFGLPWLICCSALYALYWNVVYGERGYSTTPLARVAPPSVNSGATNILVSTKRNEPRSARHEIVANAAIIPVPTKPEQQTTLRELPAVSANQPQFNPLDVMTGLQNADPSVRLQALDESDAQGIVVPAHTLQQMATTDRDPAVRIQALTKYSQDPSIEPALIIATAEAALRDGDAALSARAREILEQMSQATRTNDELPALLPDDAPVE